MLDNLKNAIHHNINELFTSAVMDEMTGDIAGHKEKLSTIAKIAGILGIDTEITTTTINLKQ